MNKYYFVLVSIKIYPQSCTMFYRWNCLMSGIEEYNIYNYQKYNKIVYNFTQINAQLNLKLEFVNNACYYFSAWLTILPYFDLTINNTTTSTEYINFYLALKIL